MPRVSALRSILLAGSFLCAISLFAISRAEAATIRVCADTALTPEVCETFRFPDEKLIDFEFGVTFEGLATISGSGAFNTDPFIEFGVTTTALVAEATTFTFTFATPIVPGVYNTASSSGSLLLTPGTEDASVTTSAEYPTYISGYGSVDAVLTNLGVDLGTADCEAPVAIPIESASCPQGSTSNVFPGTFYNNLEAVLTYSQSGLGSLAEWDGRVELLADPNGPGRIPEPAILMLVSTGIAIGLRRRHRPTVS